MRFRLYLVYINNGGYDSTGRYWGAGAPLYCAETEEGDQHYYRAYSRDDAKEKVTRDYPGVTFYR